MTNIDDSIASGLSTSVSDTSARLKKSRKKLLSFFLVCIMVLSAFSIVAFSALNSSNDQSGASTSSWQGSYPQPDGRREAVYTFNHWGEDYLKNEKWNGTNYSRTTVSMATLGHHGVFVADSTRTHGNPTGMGISDWLNGTSCIRQAYYGEVGLRVDRYPYLFGNNPNSPETPGVDFTTQLYWIVWIPYRISGTIKNETMARTGPDTGGGASGGSPAGAQHQYHAWFVPHLGANSASTKQPAYATVLGKNVYMGATINCSYYGTYLTQKEIDRIKSPRPVQGDIHYAQWFYGCSASFLSGSNDGYFYELQGRIEYSRQAAVAYLGYDNTTDIRTWFNSNKATLIAKWRADWILNASEPTTNKNSSYRGVMGIYSNYEYDLNNSGLMALQLSLDPNSTYRSLVIRLYSVSWGMDSLILRMMERCNITGWASNTTSGRNIRGSMIDYHEDLYWNISANRERSNMTFRMVNTYRLTAWEDPSSSVFMGGWMLETFHTDYLGNGAGTVVGGTYWSYPSPFERYDPDAFVTDRTTISAVPGTRRYQKNASY